MDAIGLDGIVVAETEMSFVDGSGGELIIGGRRLSELSSEPRIIELAAALWKEPLSAAEFGEARVRAHGRLSRLGGAIDQADGMLALQSALSQLPSSSTPTEIAAAVAVFASAWYRRRQGLDPLAADPTAGHAADTLRLTLGAQASVAAARALERYLVTVADHGMNASTFAARVVTSTGAPKVSAVVAAIAALSGPLHGGAPGPVLDMLEAAASDPRAWLEAELAADRRIMGMGHRVYRARDPRAAVLEEATRELCSTGVDSKLAAAQRIEELAAELLAERHRGRRLCANVEMYTAVLLDAIGLGREMFAPMFAVGRVVGWLGHIAEQGRVGRLIRPKGRYVGHVPPKH